MCLHGVFRGKMLMKKVFEKLKNLRVCILRKQKLIEEAQVAAPENKSARFLHTVYVFVIYRHIYIFHFESKNYRYYLQKIEKQSRVQIWHIIYGQTQMYKMCKIKNNIHTNNMVENIYITKYSILHEC